MTNTRVVGPIAGPQKINLHYFNQIHQNGHDLFANVHGFTFSFSLHIN